jgi:hypothetical protein
MKQKIIINRLADYSKVLEPILAKRIGGSVNIIGIHYQVLYACLAILREFHLNHEFKVRLEGIEDIDVCRPITINEFEYIQLKSSKNKLNAGDFWNLRVLQNYLEVYSEEPQSKFKLVYNMNITEGSLKDLVNGTLNTESKQYWLGKLESLSYKEIDYLDFLQSISFEFASIQKINYEILELLFEDWKVNVGTEEQFLKSLFFNVLIWSKDRKTVDRNDIEVLFQKIIDSFSKAPINEAVKDDWIKSIAFAADEKDYSSYYDGKAAMPVHIVQKLPVRRTAWEGEIEALLNNSDIVVIRSSSGQGKSTIAWQISYNKKEVYTIYQIHYCPDQNVANSIIQFIQSRLKIGQLPLIIFDGLNSSIKGWYYVVEGTANLPVKFIVTTRSEDWYRYGSDVSKSNMRFVDLSLSKEEARSIYDQLQRKGKLCVQDSWQSVWEKVQKAEVLIEYTSLLTRGVMIQERLKHQISVLSSTQSSAAKIEILRLISLSDSMNIKIRTKVLLKHIANNIGFEQDRGEVLNELSNEYFLSFDGTYIAGLHPVRSNHLVEILHENLPIEDSLVSLFDLLDDVYFSDYFINVPSYLKEGNKDTFYNEIGAKLSLRDFNQMVMALDGVFHLAPQVYWRNNRQIYDEVSEVSSIELFSITTIPFTDYASKQFDELANTLGEIGAGFSKFSTLSKQLPRFTLKETDLYILAFNIQQSLKKRTAEIDTFLGFGGLARWFRELDLSLKIPSNILSKINIDYFFNNLETFELSEAKEIVTFYLNSSREEYLQYFSEQRSKLLSYLKKGTDSLSIIEKEKNIHIDYLLYGDEVSHANEMSVSRIQAIHVFLPIYERYCTEAIMLPFPSEELISVTRDNAAKQMPPENIPNEFDVHLNQIWYTTVLKNYEASSVYEWQKSLIDLRESALELTLSLCQCVDALLEGNNKKSQSSINSIEKCGNLFRKFDLAFRPYPTYNDKYYEYNKYSKKEKDINTWLLSLRNVNNQIINFFMPREEHSRHVALINLKATYQSISAMQDCFNTIARDSFEYFDTSSLEVRERELYERVHITMLYYTSKIPLDGKPAIKVAKNVAKEWWQVQQNEKINRLRDILNAANCNNKYKFYSPSSVEETDTLTYVTVGVEGVDWSDGDSLQNLAVDLVDLADFPADFFTILNVKSGVATGGLRFRQDFFKALQQELNGQYSVTNQDLLPLPVFPDEKTLHTLDRLMLPPHSSGDSIQDRQFQITIELWKLHEYRNRLDSNSVIEKKWLKEVESAIISEIKGNLTGDMGDEFTNRVNGIIDRSILSSTDIFVDQINNIIIEAANQNG